MVLTGYFVSFAAGIAWGDTLVLRNGTSVTGNLVSATAQTVTFKNSKGILQHYKRADIQNLEFSSPGQKTTIQSVQDKKLEILPIGTEIAVRTNETIDSKSANEPEGQEPKS